MYRRTLLLFTLLFLPGLLLAQQRTVITGTVHADSLPLSDAAVVVNAADTAGVSSRTVLTGRDGRFRISTKIPRPEITVSYLGYKKLIRKVTDKAGTVDLGTLRLEPAPLLADEVAVEARAPMAVLKGDTLQFNATSFKTNPDATSEDLLKKMPGITVNGSGILTAQGEAIKKVYVDGKEFFSEQPKEALRNLPAYTVKNVQIYDDKSEKAKFTGVDDGERVKTVNIVTKSGVSTSTFGKAYGGTGTDRRYTAGAGAHIFREKHRLTVTAQTNNINNEGQNLNEVSGMGGMMGSYSFGGGGESTGRSVGLNYSGEPSKKVKLSGHYTFSNTATENRGTSQTDYLTLDRHSADTSSGTTASYRHNLMASVEWKPRETDRITFRPRIGFSTTRSNSQRRQSTLLDGLLTNAADNLYRNDGNSYNASANFGWMHRFGKEGRVLSLYADLSGSNNRSTGYQNSFYGNPDPETGQWTRDTIRQRNRSTGPSFSVSGSVSYTEPLSPSSSLNAGYDFGWNSGRSDRRGYNWDPRTQDYTLLDTVTTNLFDRGQTRHSLRLGYGYNARKKIYINASVRYELTGLHDTEDFPDLRDSRYSFGALLPQANLTWRASKAHSLGLNYNRHTQVPSADQLQEVLDISDPLRVTTGNPGLRQSYTDNLVLYYNYYDQKRSLGGGLYLVAGFTADAIAYHRRFLPESIVIRGITIPKGAQFTSPANLGGGRALTVNGSLYGPLKRIKCNASLDLRYSYSISPSIEDNVTYHSQRNEFGGGVRLNSNISEKVDFGVGYRPTVSLTRATTGSFDRLVSNDVSGNFQVNLWRGLVVRGEATWRSQSGTRESYRQDFTLLNASVGYKFLKFRQAEISLTGYDLLNQNRSFRQSTYETYVQSSTTNVLTRYFMVSFSYTFDTRRKP